MERKWLQCRARKTEGALSLFPSCYGVPMRITSGINGMRRERGACDGAARAWREGDGGGRRAIRKPWNSREARVVVRSSPKKLVVRMDRHLPKECPGLPLRRRCTWH